jgi:hypothetical protein
MPNRMHAPTGPDPRGGTLAGAGVEGAHPGSSIADAIDPDDYAAYWRDRFTAQPMFLADFLWGDYEPAYRLGYDTYSSYASRDDDRADVELGRRWDDARGSSRLEWAEARYAVHDSWRALDHMMSGAGARGRH